MLRQSPGIILQVADGDTCGLLVQDTPAPHPVSHPIVPEQAGRWPGSFASHAITLPGAGSDQDRDTLDRSRDASQRWQLVSTFPAGDVEAQAEDAPGPSPQCGQPCGSAAPGAAASVCPVQSPAAGAGARLPEEAASALMTPGQQLPQPFEEVQPLEEADSGGGGSNRSSGNSRSSSISSGGGGSPVVQAAHDVEVLYVADHVAVRPSRSQCIPGRLSLVAAHTKASSSGSGGGNDDGSGGGGGSSGVPATKHVFVAWLPYSSHGGSAQGATGQQGSSSEYQQHQHQQQQPCGAMYALPPVPLAAIRALTRHTPPLSCHRLVLTLTSGVTLPPLHFPHGVSTRPLLAVLREHALLVKCAADPATLLLQDGAADLLQHGLRSPQLDALLARPPPQAPSPAIPPAAEGAAAPAPPPPAPPGGSSSWGSTAAGLAASAIMPAVGLEGLEGLWSAIMSASVTDTLLRLWGQQEEPVALSSSPESLQPPPPGYIQLHGRGTSQPSDVAGSDGDSHSSGAAGPCALQAEEEVEVQGQESTRVGSFELLDASSAEGLGPGGGWHSSPLWGPPGAVAPPGVSMQEVHALMDQQGRLVDERGLRQRVLQSGCADHEVRRLVWPLLLGVQAVGSTWQEREAAAASRRQEYLTLRRQWSSISEAQAARFAKWRERRSRVERDIRRTDRHLPFYQDESGPNCAALRRLLLTHCMYHFDLGYCQGMSDLAAPLLLVMRDEAEAFWLFAALMDGMAGAFSSDQRAMHAQLAALRRLVALADPELADALEAAGASSYVFAFRWLLVLFKRELSSEQVPRLWEAIWACRRPASLHIWLAAALVLQQRAALLTEPDLDGLMARCLGLAGSIDPEQLLRQAMVLHAAAGKEGEACVADCLRASSAATPADSDQQLQAADDYDE